MANANYTTTRIIDRKAGRDEAKVLLEMRSSGVSNAFVEGFARAMREYADSVLGKQQCETLRAMSADEAAAFEKRKIRFGIHECKCFADVPADYLAWIADSALEIQAYLRSERGKQRLEKSCS